MSPGPHVVSGGASGIGLVTAERLLMRGEGVVVVDRMPRPDALARDDVAYFQQDVTDLDGMAAVISGILDAHPSVRSVVASAGLGLSQHFETTPRPRSGERSSTRMSLGRSRSFRVSCPRSRVKSCRRAPPTW